ncbi:host attachment protein [Solirhodobacter olei]|uniref:host attachment protein n=1 Tax=Solirhodobacter olei TaxID=2493082 RepID=UPI000FDA1D96|nr:host attachment protein [Solirhodobacter olei]
MRKPSEWILVMNAAHARLIEGLAAPRSPAPHEQAIEAHPQRPGEIMADKPGRSFSIGSGGRRSAMVSPSDPQREAERAFVDRIIEMVEKAHSAGAFDRLVVVAAPEMLGLWRAALPPKLRQAVSREVARNIANLAPLPLQEALRDELTSE